MAIEPLGSQGSNSPKAPVSKQDTGALAHSTTSVDPESVSSSTKQPDQAGKSTKETTRGTDLHGTNAGLQHIGDTMRAATGLHKPMTVAARTDSFSLPSPTVRASYILEAFGLPVTEVSRRAVLFAMAEGLKLTPKLIHKLVQFIEAHPDEDLQTCIRAIADDDTTLLESVVSLLGALRNMGDRPQGFSGQGSSGNQGNQEMIPETEEREAIKLQAKQLFLGWLLGGGSEELATYREPGFIWIQLPFSFSQGALDLTGYIRMVYTYSKHAITRVVLDCKNEAGRRLVVFEEHRSVFWSPIQSEVDVVKAIGMIVAKTAEDAETSALCGIDSVYKE